MSDSKTRREFLRHGATAATAGLVASGIAQGQEAPSLESPKSGDPVVETCAGGVPG